MKGPFFETVSFSLRENAIANYVVATCGVRSDFGRLARMSSIPQPALPSTYYPELTQDERTMAMLAHALQLAGWWIAPLVIFLTRRESRFVSFHALQALLLQLTFLCITMVGVVIFIAMIFASIPWQATAQPSAAPPPMFFLAFPFIWLGGLISWGLGLLAAILYSIKAGRGEWAGYPVLGGLARRILKIESA